MRAALISYNTFVDGERNGWKTVGTNQLFLVQNETGEKWGMTQATDTPGQWEVEAREVIEPLWGHLQPQLASLDVVVMYVGSQSSERVIRLAGENGLEPERAVFVFCNCNMTTKQGLIMGCGFGDSKQITCGCGGHREMRRIYYSILADGTLPD